MNSSRYLQVMRRLITSMNKHARLAILNKCISRMCSVICSPMPNLVVEVTPLVSFFTRSPFRSLRH